MDKKVCKCGCGEEFVPRRYWQEFKNKDHQQRWHQERYRAQALGITTDELSERRLEKLRADAIKEAEARYDNAKEQLRQAKENFAEAELRLSGFEGQRAVGGRI